MSSAKAKVGFWLHIFFGISFFSFVASFEVLEFVPILANSGS